MCTLSFIPRTNGYFVAMNRDELLTRGAAIDPRISLLGGLSVLYPTDVAGGTWIAANAHGTTWALLNWNLGMAKRTVRSRGEVVLHVAASKNPKTAGSVLTEAILRGIAPFRLIGISDANHEICEWQWDGAKLVPCFHPWKRRHWFSSGRSDEEAANRRGRVVEEAFSRQVQSRRLLLRHIHSSHEPERGAFSVCVHREDAATVSYSEIEADHSYVQMRYRAGSPCQNTPATELVVERIR